MPFQCSYCGGQFCGGHRLPENHSCPKIGLAQAQKQETVAASFAPKRNSYEFSISYGQQRQTKGHVYLGKKELKHLAVAALLVIAIGFSIAFYAGYMDYFGWTWTITSAYALILTASFLVHEMAHKITAQRRGLWSEFRLTKWGALLTLASIILPFKLISPGAVMISGPAKLDEIGKLSIAGPITNMIFSVVFLAPALSMMPSPGWWWLFVTLAMFNATIAIFNLIPFGILDGFKIFNWNRKVWFIAFASGIALAVPSYLLAAPYIF
jgi:Zn-dependent protease